MEVAMKKVTLVLFVFVALLTGCNVEETAIVCGREWNPNLEVVADTASVAHTGGGDNDFRRRVHVQHTGFLHALRHMEV